MSKKFYQSNRLAVKLLAVLIAIITVFSLTAVSGFAAGSNDYYTVNELTKDDTGAFQTFFRKIGNVFIVDLFGQPGKVTGIDSVSFYSVEGNGQLYNVRRNASIPQIKVGETLPDSYTNMVREVVFEPNRVKNTGYSVSYYKEESGNKYNKKAYSYPVADSTNTTSWLMVISSNDGGYKYAQEWIIHSADYKYGYSVVHDERAWIEKHAGDMPTEFTMSYNPNGGTRINNDNTSTTFTDGVIVNSNGYFAKGDCRFVCWSTVKCSDFQSVSDLQQKIKVNPGCFYMPGDVFRANQDTTLYAVWINKNVPAAIYNPNYPSQGKGTLTCVGQGTLNKTDVIATVDYIPSTVSVIKVPSDGLIVDKGSDEENVNYDCFIFKFNASVFEVSGSSSKSQYRTVSGSLFSGNKLIKYKAVNSGDNISCNASSLDKFSFDGCKADTVTFTSPLSEDDVDEAAFNVCNIHVVKVTDTATRSVIKNTIVFRSDESK